MLTAQAAAPFRNSAFPRPSRKRACFFERSFPSLCGWELCWKVERYVSLPPHFLPSFTDMSTHCSLRQMCRLSVPTSITVSFNPMSFARIILLKIMLVGPPASIMFVPLWPAFFTLTGTEDGVRLRGICPAKFATTVSCGSGMTPFNCCSAPPPRKALPV